MLKIAPGTIVLNQYPPDSMSGEIVTPTDDERPAVEDGMLVVRWSNGLRVLESPADLTLTAALILAEG